MGKSLDQNGVLYLWNKIKSIFVTKEAGKGLSTNDYSTAEKNKLSGVASGAEVNVQSDWSVTDTASDAFIKNKPTSMPANGGNAATVGGHTVAIDVPANAKFSDTTYSDMKGASADTAGAHGLVPQPAIGAQTKYLRGDWTWQSPPNTTYTVATASKDGLMSKADFTKLSAFGAASTYALKSDIAGMYKYKGSVDNEAALPTTGQIAGDVYNIKAASKYGAAGANVAWDGTQWDSLGEIFNIDYITNAELDSICV